MVIEVELLSVINKQSVFHVDLLQELKRKIQFVELIHVIHRKDNLLERMEFVSNVQLTRF